MEKSFVFEPRRTALIVVDMQRDFLSKGGFGELLGNNPRKLRKVVPQIQRVLQAARRAGLKIIYTREGHKPDLSDLPLRKLESLPKGKRIGDAGPMGRILIRGERGHGIIDELKPLKGETVIDKPGKGAFFKTRLESVLKRNGITHLLFAGVTTDVCVHGTVVEANDRGFHPIVLSDCVAAYDKKRHRDILRIIAAQGGLFGRVTTSKEIIDELNRKQT